jgi:hypothetical protein
VSFKRFLEPVGWFREFIEGPVGPTKMIYESLKERGE